MAFYLEIWQRPETLGRSIVRPCGVAGLIAHEVSHFYFHSKLASDTFWLVEGGANFASVYIAARQPDWSWPRQLPDDDGIVEYCAGQEIRQIVDLTPDTLTCVYGFGQYAMTSIFNAIGPDGFRSALQEMHAARVRFEYDSRPVIGRQEGQTEENIYRVFLKHTPAGKQADFKELYRRLHGGSFID